MQINKDAIASALSEMKRTEISAIPEDNEIAHTFSEEFENKTESLISSVENKRMPTSSVGKRLAKAAVIFLALSIGGFSIIMTNPPARAGFKNAVIEFYETHIKFYFVSDDESTGEFENVEWVFSDYIVPSFKLKTAEAEYGAFSYKYENEEDGLSYEVYISENDGLSVITDKNKDNVEQLKISGKDSYLISGENAGKPYSTLIVTGSKITVTVYGQITKEEAIKVGEALREKKIN